MTTPQKTIVRVKEIPLWQIFIFVLSVAFTSGGMAFELVSLKKEQIEMKATHKRELDSMERVNQSLLESISRLNTAISGLQIELKHVNKNLERIEDGS